MRLQDTFRRIDTARLSLRPLAESDREAAVALLTNGCIKKTYMVPDFASRQEADRLYDRFMALSHDDQRFVRGIYRADRLIGFINDVGIRESEIELGYVIHPAWQNQGIATEALGAAIGALFEAGFGTVKAAAFDENAASMRVMEKCGMQRTGETEEIAYRGITRRCICYAIQKPTITQ